MKRPYSRVLVRGKTISEWSEILGIKLFTAWMRYRRGTLEASIDGKTFRTKLVYNGLSAKDIQERLGVCSASAYKYLKDGTVGARLDGKPIPRNNPPPPVIIDNMTTADCQKALGGVTRERVRQLKENGLLRHRLNGVNCLKVAREAMNKQFQKKRKAIRDQRLPGESISQLAKRLKMPYSTAKYAFDGRVPFAEERKQMKATQGQKGTE